MGSKDLIVGYLNITNNNVEVLKVGEKVFRLKSGIPSSTARPKEKEKYDC